MNKWSQSLPSIMELNNNSKEKLPSSSSSSSINESDDDSLTDVSAFIQTKSNDLKPNSSIYDQLIAYANSFNLNETIYSIKDFKNQFDLTHSVKSKSRTPSSNSSTKLIPSNFFSTKKFDDYNSDENTTVTDGSKFAWENSLSNEISFQNLSTPIIICEKTTNHYLPPTIDIQVLRPSTPIIIREVLPLSTTNSSKPPVIPKRKISPERYSSKKLSSNKPVKKIIIEYDQINVKINKEIKQKKEVKRVNPYQYIQRYGSSLCSKEIFHKLFTNIVA